MKTMTPPLPSRRRAIGYTLIAAAACLLATQAALAQQAVPAPQSAATQNTDPPGRVARLNYMAGTVTTEPAGAADWSYAQINRPLTTGDQLWNDQNARSELHIGSTAVRLGQSTSLDLLNLDDTSAQLKVAQGSLSAHVRELPPGSSYEIDTPNLALGLNGPGDYRVDVAPDGSSTTVTLRSGSATAYGDGGQVPIAAGQQMRFAGTSLQTLADNGAPGPDSFDQWAASRDAAEDHSVSARYVSREIPGYEDLDANGTWRSSPQYGEVWVPRATPAGWAPYHDGHWVWQAPWGWTWVDDEPWGFAPYHYGRWAYVDDSWAWVPGPIVVSAPPVYAPALVAFVGGGGGGIDWGVNLAIGGTIAAGVAWFPLGPGEPWHPHWGNRDHWSPRYYDRVNQTTVINNYRHNVTNIHNTYINYRAPRALTAVPATAFVHGQPVGRFAQKVDPAQWRNARINPGAPGIAPVRESFGPGQRVANFRPPAAVMTRPVMATRNPSMPPAFRDGLAQRFAQHGGRVPGAGQPIVRTSVPASVPAYKAGATGGAGGLPGQNVRIVQSHVPGRPPGVAAGAPVPGAPNSGQQAINQPGRGGGPQARPGMPQVWGNVPPQSGMTGHASNGVPRPPQANGGSAGFVQQHGMPQQPGQPQGQQAAMNARHEPAWTQPHMPMAQQAQQVQQSPQRGGDVSRAPRPAVAQPPRPVEGQAPQQARQEYGGQQANREFQTRPQPQAQQAPRQEFHPQTQPRPEPAPQPQVQQAPRQEFHPQPQPRPEPRPQPQAQQAPRQEFHPQPAPHFEPRPEPRPQPQAQQPHAQPQPQPQRGEQHSGGGHDEHHRG